MGKGFGLIVTKDMRYYWIEPDSSGNVAHPEILRRAGIPDNKDQFVRHFVRVEFPEWTPASFRFDEEATLPGWCEENRFVIRWECEEILRNVYPLYEEFKRREYNARLKYSRIQVPAKRDYIESRERARLDMLAKLGKMKGKV